MSKKRSYILDDIHMTPDASYIQNPDVSHEVSDVNVRSIIVFGAGLLVFGIIVHILMSLMFGFMEARAKDEDKINARGPMALKQQEKLPPEPRLQAAPGFGVNLGEGKQPINLQLREPESEYKELRKIWVGDLNGQTDPRTGKASMPIEQAMQKVVQDGQIHVRQQAAGQEKVDIHGGMNIPSFMSSGRVTEKRDQ